MNKFFLALTIILSYFGFVKFANGDQVIYVKQWKTNTDGKIQVIDNNQELYVVPPAIPPEGIPAYKNTDSFGFKIRMNNNDYVVRMNQISDYDTVIQRIPVDGCRKGLGTPGLGGCKND